MALFDKCYEYDVADVTKEKGIYPYFRPIQESEGPVVMMEGRKVVMAGSNNYLGLTTHPRVKEAAVKAIEKYGTSCSGSRFLTGTIDLHLELEDKIARFMGKEAALLFGLFFTQLLYPDASARYAFAFLYMTLGLALLRLEGSTGGILFDGRDLQAMRQGELRPLRREMQIVFQDPFSSLSPRMSVAEIIGEGLEVHGIGTPAERQAMIDQALVEVGGDGDTVDEDEEGLGEVDIEERFGGGELEQAAGLKEAVEALLAQLRLIHRARAPA